MSTSTKAGVSPPGLWALARGDRVRVALEHHAALSEGRVEDSDGLHLYIRVGIAGVYKFYRATGRGVGAGSRGAFLVLAGEARDAALARAAARERPRRQPRTLPKGQMRVIAKPKATQLTIPGVDS